MNRKGSFSEMVLLQKEEFGAKAYLHLIWNTDEQIYSLSSFIQMKLLFKYSNLYLINTMRQSYSPISFQKTILSTG